MDNVVWVGGWQHVVALSQSRMRKVLMQNKFSNFFLPRNETRSYGNKINTWGYLSTSRMESWKKDFISFVVVVDIDFCWWVYWVLAVFRKAGSREKHRCSRFTRAIVGLILDTVMSTLPRISSSRESYEESCVSRFWEALGWKMWKCIKIRSDCYFG